MCDRNDDATEGEEEGDSAQNLQPRSLKIADFDVGMGMFYFQTDRDVARTIVKGSSAILERLKVPVVKLSRAKSLALIDKIAWISRRYHYELELRDRKLDARPLNAISVTAKQLVAELAASRAALRLVAPELRQDNVKAGDFLVRLSADLELLASACETPLDVQRRGRGRPDNQHVRNAVGSLAALWERFTGRGWVRDIVRPQQQHSYEGNVFVEEAMRKIDPRLSPGTIAKALQQFDLAMLSDWKK
jgi:hypothetical protein